MRKQLKSLEHDISENQLLNEDWFTQIFGNISWSLEHDFVENGTKGYPSSPHSHIILISRLFLNFRICRKCSPQACVLSIFRYECRWTGTQFVCKSSTQWNKWKQMLQAVLAKFNLSSNKNKFQFSFIGKLIASAGSHNHSIWAHSPLLTVVVGLVYIIHVG